MCRTGALIFNNASLHGFWMTKWYQKNPNSERLRMIDHLLVRPPVSTARLSLCVTTDLCMALRLAAVIDAPESVAIARHRTCPAAPGFGSARTIAPLKLPSCAPKQDPHHLLTRTFFICGTFFFLFKLYSKQRFRILTERAFRALERICSVRVRNTLCTLWSGLT